jgi:O-antigen/teichoic acid export membrane protein
MTADGVSSDHTLGGFFGRDLTYVVLWAAQLGLATLITPVVTRLLGPMHFGLAASCLALMQLLVAIAGFGLGAGAQRVFANNGDREARKVVTLSLAFAVLCLILLTVSGRLWAPVLRFGHYSGAVPFAVEWAMCSAVTMTVMAVLRSRDQLKRFALVSLMQTTLAEALSLMLVLFVRRTASEYILGELLGQAATLIVALCLVRPVVVGRRDLGPLRAVLRFSAPLMPMALAAFVLSNSDRLVVNADLGHVAAARYAVASNVGSIALLLLGSVSESWMPRVFSLAGADLQEALARSRNALYVLLLPFTIGVCIAAPLLLRVWAPSSYRTDSLQLLVVLITVSAYPFAGTSSSGRILMRAGRTGQAAAATGGAAVMNLALNIILVPVIGISGSALATLVAYAVMHVLLVASARKVSPLPSPGRRLIGEIAVVGCLAFAVIAIPLTLPFLVVRGVVGLLCGLAVLGMLAGFRGMSTGWVPRSFSSWVDARVGT